MKDVNDISAAVDRLYTSFEKDIAASKPAFVSLIEQVTGWHGVDDLAELCIRVLQNNVGGNGGMPWRIRCACGNLTADDGDDEE